MRSHSKALFAVAALLALCALVPIAQGAPGEAITSFGGMGTEGGQLDSPAGLAVNNASGDVYVANTANNRIEQFTQDGTFNRAWGRDVVKDGGPGDIPPTPVIVNEQQTIGIGGPFDFGCFCFGPLTGGTFTLSFDGQSTAAIPYDATPAQVQSALEALANIDTVTVTEGGPGFSVEWTVEFTGALAGTDVAEMSADPSALEPSGSTGTIATVENGSTNLEYEMEICTDPTTCKAGVTGAGEGEFSFHSDETPQLAIDQSDGSLYVADTENHRIQRFSASGAFIDEFGVKGTGEGEFDRPRGVAVDPSTSDIYVADTNNNRVQRFDNTGGFKYEMSGFAFPRRLAVDSLGRLYVLEDGNNKRIQRFDNTGAFEKVFASGLLQSATELAVDPATNHPYIAATLEGVAGIHEFDAAGEWIETYGAEAGATAGGLALPSASNRIFVSDTPKDRVVRITFSTDPVPPFVETLPAGVVTDSSAWLGAKINPLKSATSFWVEYSTDEDLEDPTSIPAGKNASTGKGNKVLLANQLVKGLEPETTYYYRVVASSVGGTTEGEIGSFTTLADTPPVQGLPDGRVWEKVSPADKAGSHIYASNRDNINFQLTSYIAQAASDGNSIVFASDGKFAGAEGGPPGSQYLARRGPGGWVTEAISALVKPLGGIDHIDFYPWLSKDLGLGIVKTNAALNPGDPEKVGDYNLYLRDNATKAYHLLSGGDPSVEFRGASEDSSTIFFTPGGSVIDEGKLFQRTPNGDIEPVGILPDGGEVEAGIGSGATRKIFFLGFNPVSADGSRVYFTPFLMLLSDGNIGQSKFWSAPLFLREGGTTTLVSASERSGDDPTAFKAGGHFFGASKDGSVAFFASRAQLTDHSNPENACELPSKFDGFDIEGEPCSHLYRWDGTAPQGHRLTDITAADPIGSAVLGVTGMSEDGSSVYFVAAGDLTGIGNRKEAKLYLWREGEGVRLVANAADVELWSELMSVFTQFRGARVTPDGRFLAFESEAQLTSYFTAGTKQIYLYDSITAELTCISCGTVSARSKGNSWLLSSTGNGNTEEGLSGDARDPLTKNLSDDGKRLLFDSKDALVPEDTNGAYDVYEWQAGRLHLLSSGTSAFASRLLDTSEDQDNVFFTTEQQLVRSDKDGLRDLYDARVGGVAEPDVTPPCVADECQGTPRPAPNFPTPSSASFKGTGNVNAGKPRCAKGKVRRKGRCVKQKARKAKGGKAKRANSNRRAGR